MKRLAVLVLITILAAAHNAPAQEVISSTAGRAAPDAQLSLKYTWDSVHFTLYTDFADDAYARKLLGDMERFFSKLQKEYWDFIRPPYREAHITVASVGMQEAFDLVAGRDANIPPGEKGYSNKEANRIAFLRQDEYYKDVMIVVHELAHVFNRFSLDATPVWLDEGMAQYYANYAGEECGNPYIQNGVSHDSVKRVMSAAEARTLVLLPVFFRMTHQEFYATETDLHYAEAWSIVYYLRKGIPGGEDLLARYYAALPKSNDSVAAFGDIFGPDAKAIEVEWLACNQSLYQAEDKSRKRTVTNVVPIKDK